jgi:hypothetical protein
MKHSSELLTHQPPKSSTRLIFFVDEIDHRKYAEKANTIAEGYYKNKIPDGHFSLLKATSKR